MSRFFQIEKLEYVKVHLNGTRTELFRVYKGDDEVSSTHAVFESREEATREMQALNKDIPCGGQEDPCEGEKCQECCPHDEFDHHICLACSYEKCPGEDIDAAEYAFGDR